MGSDADYGAAQVSNPLRQRSAQLSYGLLKRAFATNVYQVRDRLGLGQIDAPVQKRATAELRGSKARLAIEIRVEHRGSAGYLLT
jgi:hypothetical protein